MLSLINKYLTTPFTNIILRYFEVSGDSLELYTSASLR